MLKIYFGAQALDSLSLVKTTSYLEWTDLDNFFFEIGQNFTTNVQVLSVFRFGFAFLLKSIKGDFLQKMELSEQVKVIFWHS